MGFAVELAVGFAVGRTIDSGGAGAGPGVLVEDVEDVGGVRGLRVGRGVDVGPTGDPIAGGPAAT